jgi:hypothetical protein
MVQDAVALGIHRRGRGLASRENPCYGVMEHLHPLLCKARLPGTRKPKASDSSGSRSDSNAGVAAMTRWNRVSYPHLVPTFPRGDAITGYKGRGAISVNLSTNLVL